MAHYICTGECAGVALEPGTCQAPDCSKKEQPLKECQCSDGMHSGTEEDTTNPTPQNP